MCEKEKTLQFSRYSCVAERSPKFNSSEVIMKGTVGIHISTLKRLGGFRANYVGVCFSYALLSTGFSNEDVIHILKELSA